MINFLLFNNSAIYGKNKNDKGLNYNVGCAKPIGSGTCAALRKCEFKNI